ncbi:dienelactone hydrolase family protein [bacterium]|nr:dienelactone hydrolase family protein [bacterium]
MKFVWLLIIALIPIAVEAAIKMEPVDYSSGGVTMKGFLAYDDANQGKRPGVLVVHEWWGHNEYVRKRARMLAELGYTALAVDMYGGGKQTAHPAEAGKFTQEVMSNMDIAKARFLAAMETLKAHKTVDPQRIAAIGYCFGGGLVLEMARAGVDLDGIVSFHGSLDTKNPAKPGVVKAKILVAHGAADEFIEPKVLAAFEQEMKNAKVDYKLITYPDAKHSFTNSDADEMGKKANIAIAYNAEADRKSWEDMKSFFKEIFGT